jgi:hypothetical protein
VLDATGTDGFAPPDLTSFCRLEGLGLVVTGQRIEPDRAVLACRTVAEDGWCGRCGGGGVVRDSVTRRLAHEPFGWRPTTLVVTLRRRATMCHRSPFLTQPAAVVTRRRSLLVVTISSPIPMV